MHKVAVRMPLVQTSEPSAGEAVRPERLRQLRRLMAQLKVDCVLVPRADEHQGEYVAPYAERLLWLTGFSGSAGLAAITRRAAALFVDGRYIAQARGQIDTQSFEILELPGAKLSDWISNQLPSEGVVGFDPWLHTAAEIERLSAALENRRIRLKPLAHNPIDRLWGRARPKPPCGQVRPHPLHYSGKPAEAKLADIQKQLREEKQDAAILTLPDSIAWLLNIRGSDLPHSPLAFAFAIVPAAGRAELYIDFAKLDAQALRHLKPVATIKAPESFADRIAALRAADKRVRIDPDTAAYWFFRRLGGGKKRIARAPDPCRLPKAVKNSVEIAGARAAHKRDGTAMVRFLSWLEREAPKGKIDEMAAAAKVAAFRAETQALQGLSFDTIAGSGPNGAIVHYCVSAATNRHLRPGELFLIDSGGQYLDGTTDVTRTVAIGAPTREMRERFTLVLKGHIAIATARFPKQTRGVDLDSFARRALWSAGLDFDHGTGHGVGSYLSVHEGPQSISKRGMAVLEPGMILSNEPGYYKEGAYGIRIESLVLVTEPKKVAGGEREMMGFETLTLVPIDRHLVVPELLSAEELAWLNAYHARVREIIGPELGPEDRAWLEAATQAIL
jgi:Xaa-Pro aminopeptidase